MKTLWLILLAVLPAYSSAGDLASHKSGIWSIDATPAQDRWVVIHHLEASGRTGVYHIEVIGRPHGAEPWRIVRLAPHMAITAAALEKSVRSPLNKGAVYPEAFDGAYAKWQVMNGGKGGEVCRTSVSQCMPLPGRLP